MNLNELDVIGVTVNSMIFFGLAVFVTLSAVRDREWWLATTSSIIGLIASASFVFVALSYADVVGGIVTAALLMGALLFGSASEE